MSHFASSSLLKASSSNEKSPAILYSPLNENRKEIRFITILSKSRHSSVVHCKLETVSLASFNANHIPTKQCYRYTWGDYAALSYVWGDPNKRRQIVLNGQNTYVTENLEAALRALSEGSNFESGYKLWVDALCINQNDYRERANEIGKMRNIYGDAWAVIGWLGNKANGSDKAIHLIKTLSKFSGADRGQELEAILHKDPEYLGNGSWLALHEFMDRPYWYRLWIIQEVVLGAPAVVFYCGKRLIEWPSFCAGIGVLHNHLWLIKDTLLERESGDYRWSTTSLHLIHQDLRVMGHCEEQGGGRLGFGRLLDLAYSAECCDVRDKVYGLVGMMDSVIAQELAPDYGIEPCEVFSAAARAFIRIYGNLEPIREGNPWSKTFTPSWAADWDWDGRVRHARTETPTWGQFWNKGSGDLGVSRDDTHHASGKMSSEVSFSEDGQLLTCRGFIFDHIVGLGASGDGLQSWFEQSVIQPKKWRTVRSVYGDAADTSKALYCTLIQDRVDNNGHRASDRHAAIFSLPSTFEIAAPQFKRLGWKFLSDQESHYYRWDEWRQANKWFWLCDRYLDDLFTDDIPDNASEQNYIDVYCSFHRTCKRRRLMLTRKGYIGWAPDNIFGNCKDQTWEGDLIAVVFGCSTPIIIRPHGEHFQVVGEAYVQGIMDGEAMVSLESGDCQVQNFTFC
ncbi:HET-domain-containing protein [Cenococcum geophilum 1.58]|uniref:HET-domain-containing protein n=1 Tax=Cenococcum geophilum 1.58 TaxID=794803 RepID=UPI00358F038B|nr:HET-domain-containing protein [Cenococcum geophilum 1.58]